MSEQYRCSECGHFVEILDDAICDVCNIGKMQHLRYIRGGDGSHWEGCEDVHWDCRIAQLEAELARRDEIIGKLKRGIEDIISTADFSVVAFVPVLPMTLDEVVTELKALMKELE